MSHERELRKAIQDLRKWVYRGPYSVLHIANQVGLGTSTLSMAKKRGRDWGIRTDILLKLAKARDKLEAEEDNTENVAGPPDDPMDAQFRRLKDALKHKRKDL